MDAWGWLAHSLSAPEPGTQYAAVALYHSELLAACSKAEIVVWSLQSAARVSTLRPALPDRPKFLRRRQREQEDPLKSDLRCVAFSLCGEYVAAGCDDHLVRVWETRSGALVRQLAGHRDVVFRCAFSGAGGEDLVACSADGTVRRWDWREGAERPQTIGHDATLRDVACMLDDSGRYRVVTACNDGTAGLWDVTQQVKLGSVAQPAAGEGVTCVALAANGLSLAMGSSGGMVSVWNVASFLRDLETVITESRGTRVPPPSAYVALRDDLISSAEGGDAELFARVLAEARAGTAELGADADGDVAASTDNSYQEPPLESVGYHADCVARMRHDRGVTALVFSESDDKLLFSAALDCTARVWNAAAGEQLFQINTPRPPAGLAVASAPALHARDSSSHDVFLACGSRVLRFQVAAMPRDADADARMRLGIRAGVQRLLPLRAALAAQRGAFPSGAFAEADAALVELAHIAGVGETAAPGTQPTQVATADTRARIDWLADRAYVLLGACGRKHAQGRAVAVQIRRALRDLKARLVAHHARPMLEAGQPVAPPRPPRVAGPSLTRADVSRLAAHGELEVPRFLARLAADASRDDDPAAAQRRLQGNLERFQVSAQQAVLAVSRSGMRPRDAVAVMLLPPARAEAVALFRAIKLGEPIDPVLLAQGFAAPEAADADQVAVLTLESGELYAFVKPGLQAKAKAKPRQKPQATGAVIHWGVAEQHRLRDRLKDGNAPPTAAVAAMLRPEHVPYLELTEPTATPAPNVRHMGPALEHLPVARVPAAPPALPAPGPAPRPRQQQPTEDPRPWRAPVTIAPAPRQPRAPRAAPSPPHKQRQRRPLHQPRHKREPTRPRPRPEPRVLQLPVVGASPPSSPAAQAAAAASPRRAAADRGSPRVVGWEEPEAFQVWHGIDVRFPTEVDASSPRPAEAPAVTAQPIAMRRGSRTGALHRVNLDEEVALADTALVVSGPVEGVGGGGVFG